MQKNEEQKMEVARDKKIAIFDTITANILKTGFDLVEHWLVFIGTYHLDDLSPKNNLCTPFNKPEMLKNLFCTKFTFIGYYVIF